MKNKVIKESYDKETGVCKITIQNKYGHFTGEAKCCPEDMDQFSTFTGSRYAEIRAAANFMKYKAKEEKTKLKAIQNLKKDIQHYYGAAYDSVASSDPIIRFINLKLRDYTQAISDWENLYHYLENTIKDQDEERQKILLRAK